MPGVTLPPEVISLVHHIELNKAGWWDRAIQQLVLAAIWLSSGKSLSAQEIVDYYRREFQVNLDVGKVNSQIDILCSSNVLVPLPKQRFKISERALKEFEKQLKEAEEIEIKAKGRFFEVLAQCCPLLAPEETWLMVNKQLILPMIQMMGARTYELISGSMVDWQKDAAFQNYLGGYPAEIRKQLRAAISTFLDPKDAVVRSYVLSYLNSFFCLEAGNLTETTLRAVTELGNLKPSFIVFVDTNFLFSILELHENPSNEAALLLKDLIKQLPQTVLVKLYVLPTTVDETRRVLHAYQKYLSDLRLTPNLAEASLDTSLSGIVQRYFEESKRSGSSLSAEIYFDPYIKNLLSIIRSKNVELFNEKVDQYKTDQNVIDDILAQMKFEKSRYGESAKTYEQLEHDMVLWHFVREKRPTALESPLDAKYWIVTVDFRFLGFDAYKRRELREAVQTCLHPTTLIQMLQFWMPRTQKFEEAMLSSMRLPFLFQEFDPAAERVTIRILEVLGRFENVGDLSKETITAILIKDALRQKLSSESDIKKQIELVKEALIEENQKTIKELEISKQEAEILRKEVNEKKNIIRKIEAEIATQRSENSEMKRLLSEEKKERERLEGRLLQLEKELAFREQKDQTRKAIGRFVRGWIPISLSVVALVGLLTGSVSIKFLKLSFWEICVIAWAVFLAIWIGLTDRCGLRNEVVRGSRLFVYFHKFKVLLFTLLAAVFLGVLGNAFWEWIKRAYETLSK